MSRPDTMSPAHRVERTGGAAVTLGAESEVGGGCLLSLTLVGPLDDIAWNLLG